MRENADQNNSKYGHFLRSVYDPVEYLQPIIVQLKIIIQEICKLKVEWDHVIDSLLPKWKETCKKRAHLIKLWLTDVILFITCMIQLNVAIYMDSQIHLYPFM